MNLLGSGKPANILSNGLKVKFTIILHRKGVSNKVVLWVVGENEDGCLHFNQDSIQVLPQSSRCLENYHSV